MLGILCEKPSAARNFAKALGGMSGTYNGEQYVIAALRGHIVEFAKPESNVPKELSGKYHSWNLDLLPWEQKDFLWKYVKKKDVASIISNLKKAFKGVDEICIATDDDPGSHEGELLAWEAINVAAVSAKKYSRMYFADEAPNSIQKAFKTRVTIPSQAKDNEYLTGLYRSKWDYLSMQFTRIATVCAGGTVTLRQGRLKSAMVTLVGDQIKKCNAYKKVPSYSARFKDENGVIYTDEAQKQYAKKEDVPIHDFHDSSVTKDKTERKTTRPPKLIDLATLSGRLAPKGISAKKTLSMYQAMYQDQVLSYPRTEDTYITSEQFDELLPLAPKIAKVVGVDAKHLTHKAKRKTHVKEGCAHGANRPGPKVPKSLADLDNKYGKGAGLIYEILAKSYLAMLCEDYEYDKESGHVTDFPTFKGSANIPAVLGWKAVYDDDSGDDENENAKGLGKMAKPYVHEGFPPKPQWPTMKWLMKQLEKGATIDGSDKGKRVPVGTGATRSSSYAEISSSRNPTSLFHDSRGKITFTDAGEMSYRLLPDTHIGNLSVTAKLWDQLHMMEKGNFDPEVGFAEMAQYVIDDIATMKKNAVTMRQELGIKEPDKTPKEKATGEFGGKEISFNRSWGGHRFTDAEVQTLLSGGEVDVMDAVSQKGSPMAARGKLERQQFRGRWFWGFKPTQWLNAQEPPNMWAKHKFTDAEKKTLQAGGKVHVKDGKSSKGRKLDCEVRWSEDEGIVPSFSRDF